MKLCIPVQEDKGLQSEVNHFGSSKYFLVVDTETTACRSLANQVHVHGECRPVQALSAESIDGVVVGGIGKGALMKLRASGIEVYLSGHHTVEEVVAASKVQGLQPAVAEDCCGGHGSGHNCSSVDQAPGKNLGPRGIF